MSICSCVLLMAATLISPVGFSAYPTSESIFQRSNEWKARLKADSQYSRKIRFVKNDTTIDELFDYINASGKIDYKLKIEEKFSGIKICAFLNQVEIGKVINSVYSGLSNKNAEWKWFFDDEKKIITLKPSSSALNYNELIKKFQRETIKNLINDINKELKNIDSNNPTAKSIANSEDASLFPYLEKTFPNEKLIDFIFSGKGKEININENSRSMREYLQLTVNRLFKNNSVDDVKILLEPRMYGGLTHPALTLSFKSKGTKTGFSILGNLDIDQKIGDMLSENWIIDDDSVSVTGVGNVASTDKPIEGEIEKIPLLFRDLAMQDRSFVYFSLPDEDEFSRNFKFKGTVINIYLKEMSKIPPEYMQHKINSDIILFRRRIFPAMFNPESYLPWNVLKALNDWPFHGSDYKYEDEVSKIREMCSKIRTSHFTLINDQYSGFGNLVIWKDFFGYLDRANINTSSLFTEGVRVSNSMKDSLNEVKAQNQKLDNLFQSNQALWVKIVYSSSNNSPLSRDYDFVFLDKNNKVKHRVAFGIAVK